MSLELNFSLNKHSGRHNDFIDRFQLVAAHARAGGRQSYKAFCTDLLTYMSDERNLMSAMDHLRISGGPTPGPDGEKLVNLDRMAEWSLIRDLRDQLREGSYRRGPLRRCCVPKRPGSTEKRTIYVANLGDRVAARAAAQVLVPLLEPIIDPHVYSWRRRGPVAALAYAVRQVNVENRTHLVTEDLRNAFDEVPRERLLDILRHHVPNDEYCRLLVDIAARPLGRGILQGSALSPPLLDLYVSHFLHRPWQRDKCCPPLVSYVDDLWIGCKLGEDASRRYGVLEQNIRAAGMQPKHGREVAISDLTRQSVTWLGFRIRLVRGELRICSEFFAAGGPEKSRAKHQLLVDRFARLHERPGGWRDPNSVILGIVSRLAPTLPYENPQRIYERIAQAAAEAGFQEILTLNEVHEHWMAAHDRWLAKLNGADGVRPTTPQASEHHKVVYK